MCKQSELTKKKSTDNRSAFRIISMNKYIHLIETSYNIPQKSFEGPFNVITYMKV